MALDLDNIDWPTTKVKLRVVKSFSLEVCELLEWALTEGLNLDRTLAASVLWNNQDCITYKNTEV